MAFIDFFVDYFSSLFLFTDFVDDDAKFCEVEGRIVADMNVMLCKSFSGEEIKICHL